MRHRPGQLPGRQGGRRVRGVRDPGGRARARVIRSHPSSGGGTAYFALLLIHLHFPDSGSLKAKRKELSSIKAQLHTRLGLAAAEVAWQDTWQRSTLAATTCSGSLRALDEAVDRVERWLMERCPEGVRVERRVTTFDEARGLG